MKMNIDLKNLLKETKMGTNEITDANSELVALRYGVKVTKKQLDLFKENILKKNKQLLPDKVYTLEELCTANYWKATEYDHLRMGKWMVCLVDKGELPYVHAGKNGSNARTYLAK